MALIEADARYAFDASTTPVEFQISHANVRIEKLAVREDGSLDPEITIPVLNVEGCRREPRDARGHGWEHCS